jgi:transposase-like protein
LGLTIQANEPQEKLAMIEARSPEISGDAQRCSPEAATAAGRTRRRPVVGVVCPRCLSKAIYRYGRTASKKKRYLCQVCRHQFTLRRAARLDALVRPTCPVCERSMHIYMHRNGIIRFRCSRYPECRTYMTETKP